MAERVLVVAFALVVTVPGLATVAGLDREAQRDERSAQARIADDSQSAAASQAGGWAALPQAFISDFEEHFAFRARLVRWQAVFRERVLHVSPLPSVIRGRDGWLFYADDDALVDLVNTTPFTPAELDGWVATLQHTQDWLARQGIAYLFVIVPDKHVIYPEFLPATIHAGPGPTRTDQLVEALRARSTVPVLDLRGPLLAAKTEARVYHRTDSHWNALGAYVGYAEMMRRLQAASPRWAAALAPRPRDSFRIHDETVPGRDLAEMMGLRHWRSEERPVFTPVNGWHARVVEPADPDPQFDRPRVVSRVDDPHLPRALVYRDSFGGEPFQFLAEHFSRMLYLWEYDVNAETVASEHPDVVIQQWAGRRLHTRPPYDGVPRDGTAAISSSGPARP